MGVYVRLSVNAARIPTDDWPRVYEETVRVLKSWPDPPLGIQERVIAGQRLVVYTRAFEHEEGWRIVGDARTRRRAESFDFPRSPRWLGSKSPRDSYSTMLHDVVLGRSGGGVFSEKTQGEPYHDLLVAVGLLVETRFPGAAVVHGNITRREGDRARKALAALFGEPFELPVVMDGARLRALVPEDTPGLDRFIDSHRSYRSEAEVKALLAKFGFEFLEPSFEDDIERNALICIDANKLGSKARAALEDLADKLTERSFGLEVGARTRRTILNRQEMLEEIAKGTCRMRLRLTEMAWDEILACDDEAELRLVWLLSLSNADKRIPRLLARATFENRALRRFMLSYQRSKSAQSVR